MNELNPQPTIETSIPEGIACLPVIADYFDELPPLLLRQPNGRYRVEDIENARTPEEMRECGCCVCAHIAFMHGVPNEVDLVSGKALSFSYHTGIKILQQKLGMDEHDLERLLTRHGAPREPFSSEAWNRPPGDVFRAAWAELAGGTG